MASHRDYVIAGLKRRRGLGGEGMRNLLLNKMEVSSCPAKRFINIRSTAHVRMLRLGNRMRKENRSLWGDDGYLQCKDRNGLSSYKVRWARRGWKTRWRRIDSCQLSPNSPKKRTQMNPRVLNKRPKSYCASRFASFIRQPVVSAAWAFQFFR